MLNIDIIKDCNNIVNLKEIYKRQIYIYITLIETDDSKCTIVITSRFIMYSLSIIERKLRYVFDINNFLSKSLYNTYL